MSHITSRTKTIIRSAFDTLSSEIESINTSNGWSDTSRTEGEGIALLHSEVSELFEYSRSINDKPSDHIPQFTGREEELADIVIRCFNHVHRHLPCNRLAEAILAKLEYNKTRGYRHGNKVV